MHYQTKLPGEFPKAYTMADIAQIKEAERPIRDQLRKPGTSTSARPTLQLGLGPGMYETDKDRNEVKISTAGSFGKQTRLNLPEFLHQQGEASAGPGPGQYFPHQATTTKHHHRDNSNKKLPSTTDLEVKKSMSEIQRSLDRLNLKSFTVSRQTLRSRFQNARDAAGQPGPGHYNPLDQDQVARTSGFGKTARKDLLSNLIDAGHISRNELGPGAYEVSAKSFFANETLNTRCGYHAPVAQAKTTLRPFQYSLPTHARWLGPKSGLGRGKNKTTIVQPADVWKHLMSDARPMIE